MIFLDFSNKLRAGPMIGRILFLLFFAPLSAGAYELCPGITIDAPEPLSFSANERRLLCGDPESHAWQKIPPTQARYFARIFLQDRGYLDPSFDIRDGGLVVEVGPLRRVEHLIVNGAPASFRLDRRRNLRGRPLNPDILNETEAWAKTRLQELGYACVKLELQAFPQNGEIRIQVDPGPQMRFGEVQRFGMTTKPGLVERNQAFYQGQVFDPRLLQLSTNRLIGQELYIGSYFDPRCDRPLGPNNEIQIDRHLVSSTPRLLTFGVGVDSEVGPILKTSFRHVLLTENGSQGQVTLTASYREQKFEARMQHYPLSDARSRVYIEPRYELRRELEDQFESVTNQFSVSPGFSIETDSAEHRASIGPAIEDVRVFDNATGPRQNDSTFVTFNAAGKSHLFEYFVAEPQEGWNYAINVNSRLRGVDSPTTYHRFQVDLLGLWNVLDFDPPLMVVGTRIRLGSFIFEDRLAGLGEVPVSQRFFIGGDSDLRGFARKQLPLDASGFVSSYTQGLELRFVEMLPFKLQPLIIFDFGWGGHESLKLDDTLYYSPGVGLRWSSPLGPVRTTLAQGRISQPTAASGDLDARWQWFVSFGREF
ncbi:MAG: BamA/TamA family outer membrane protein [Bdellovibrionaceae bacterium]|nr:BamA/TamA family outer membrane protein [Pseudobdellovibrionaceae bacterium]